MKKRAMLLLALSAYLFMGCEKEQPENPIIIEPTVERILLETDSINSGERLGITIGSDAPEVYRSLQRIRETHLLGVVQVVGNVFSTLSALAERLPLYNQLLLDEQVGTGSGIQLYFEDGRVKSIWTNNGDKLYRWPQNPFSKARITINDPVTSVYQKLVTIAGNKQFARKFERMSLFAKDLGKAYDANMATSKEWYFAISETEKHLRVYHLYFTGGKLTAIKTELLGPPAERTYTTTVSQTPPGILLRP